MYCRASTNRHFIKHGQYSVSKNTKTHYPTSRVEASSKRHSSMSFLSTKCEAKQSCSQWINIIMSIYHNSLQAKSMRSEAHHVSKSPALKLKLPSRMRQKFPKRPSAYQIILPKLQHTGRSPLPEPTQKSFMRFILSNPLFAYVWWHFLHTKKHVKARRPDIVDIHTYIHTHAHRPRHRFALCRGDAADKPGERLASTGHSMRHGRRSAKTHPGLESPKSRVSKEAGILPGCRSFLSGN